MSLIDIKFITDQTGANNNVCSGSDIIFNFSLTDTYNANGAYISLKKGSGTTDSISAIIYDQPNAAGTQIASSVVLATNTTQSYTETPFLFSGITLYPGISYSLVLRSSTSRDGNNPYSMKSGNFQVLNASTNGVLNTGYGVSTALSSACSLSATASKIKSQKIYLNNNKAAKFRIGSKTPKIYKGSSVLYNPNNN